MIGFRKLKNFFSLQEGKNICAANQLKAPTLKDSEKQPCQSRTRKRSVKIGLKSICSIPAFRQRSQEDTQIMSNLMYEVSNLAYFGLNQLDRNLLMNE